MFNLIRMINRLTGLNNVGAVPISSQNFSNLMQPGVREAFFNSYDDTVKKRQCITGYFVC